MASLEQKYPIGTVFRDRRGRTQSVVDVLRTYNAAGELVKLRYVTSFQFCGQMIRDRDVITTTIDMGEVIHRPTTT